MNHLPIWFIGNIPSDLCDRATDEFSRFPLHEATMGIQGNDLNHIHRNTSVRFIDRGHWFEDKLKSVAYIGNKLCDWQYEITGNENIQFAEYGIDQHYQWHTDTFALSGQPLDRKLTAVCLLNDPSEFTGGDFQVRLYTEYNAPLTKGSVIAFPSILEHRVTKVLSGIRKTATMWLNGPRFK